MGVRWAPCQDARVAGKRWTITDEAGRRHEVSLTHGIFGANLSVDGRSLRYKPFRSAVGSYTFPIAGHSAQLEVHRDLTAYLYDLRLDGRLVGEQGVTLSPESAAASTSAIEQRLRLEQTSRNGANWFYWIGGLSILNSLFYANGTDWGFLAGLGITQVIDAFAIGFSETARTPMYAIVLDVAVAAAFLWVGRAAIRGRTHVYTAGMAVYALDALLFVWVADWIGLGFHGLALVGMWSGWRAARSLREVERAVSNVAGARPAL